MPVLMQFCAFIMVFTALLRFRIFGYIYTSAPFTHKWSWYIVSVIIYWPVPDSFLGLPYFERSSSILRTVCLSVSLGYITINILGASYEYLILVECDKPSYRVGTLLPVLCVPVTSLVLSRFPTLIPYMVVCSDCLICEHLMLEPDIIKGIYDFILCN